MKKNKFAVGDIVILKDEFVPLDHNSIGSPVITPMMTQSSVSNHPQQILEINENDNCLLSDNYYYDPEWLVLLYEHKSSRQKTTNKLEETIETLHEQVDELMQLVNTKDKELHDKQLEIDEWKEETKDWFNEAKTAWSRFHDINADLCHHLQEHNRWKTKVREMQLDAKLNKINK